MSTATLLGTLFRLTLASGVPAAVALHLQRGAPVNGRDGKGRTPLILAAMRGHTEVCRLLLEAGADAALQDDGGHDALAAARAGGHSPAATLIAASTVPETGRKQDAAPTPVFCTPQPDEPLARASTVPDAAPNTPAARSFPAGSCDGQSTGSAAPLGIEPIALAAEEEGLESGDAGARQIEGSWVAEEDDPQAGPPRCDAPWPGTEAVNRPVEAASPALPVEVLGVQAETSADLLWEPEPEPLLVPSEDGIETAAAMLEAGLTRHTASIPDPAWVDTDVDLPATAPAWAACFVDGFDAHRAATGLLETALRDGWLPSEDLDTLEVHAAKPDNGGAVAGAFRAVLGALGVVVEGEHALDLSREDRGGLEFDEPAFRRAEAAGAVELLDGLSGGFPDAESMLLAATGRAPVLSASEEAFLFRELASSLGTMLRLVASSPSTAGVLLSWADRLEAGLLAPKEVSETEWGVGVEEASAPRAVETTEDGSGEDEAASSDDREDGSAASALAARLRDAAKQIADTGEAAQILAATSLTSRRVLELAEGALPSGGRAPRRGRRMPGPASRGGPSDLRLLRRPPEGRRISRPEHGIGAALDRYLAVREAIVEANLRRVVRYARRYARGPVPFLDLVQEGQIGLLRAIDRYDVERGWRFGTYATWWIRQAMSRCVQDTGRTIRIPVHMLERIVKARRRAEAFRAKHGFEPAPADIARDTEMDVRAVERALAVDCETVPLDRTEEVSAEERDASVPTDRAAPAGLVDQGTPLATALHADLRRRLLAALQELDQRQARILDLRFGVSDGDPLTLEEVGQVYGVTRERIRQIEAKALDRLPRHMPSRHFENLVP